MGEDQAAQGSGPSCMLRIIGRRSAGARGGAAGGAIQPLVGLPSLGTSVGCRQNAMRYLAVYTQSVTGCFVRRCDVSSQLNNAAQEGENRG